jgi:hypothetical protein
MNTYESRGYVFARISVSNLRCTGIGTPVNWRLCQFYDKESRKWHNTALEATVFDRKYGGELVTDLRLTCDQTMAYLFIEVTVTSSDKIVVSRDLVEPIR